MSTETDTDTAAPKHWPPSLQKATCDPFTYAAYIRHVGVVTFEEAELVFVCDWLEEDPDPDMRVNEEWVHLNAVEFTDQPSGFQGGRLPTEGSMSFTFDRGLDVRVSDLVWVADAPWGS